MKHKIYMMGAMLLMLLTTACREESDSLLSYDHNQDLAFSEAAKSYVGKFKVTWNGLNQYYALWDYEKEQGLDWDAVYDEYLPKFEALDQRDEDDPVTDDELKELLAQVLSPLHDGHFVMTWKNHATGHDVYYLPSKDRNASRDDAKAADIKPDHFYYANIANGEIMTDESGQRIALEYSTRWIDLAEAFRNTEGKGMKYIDAEIERIAGLTTPTEMEVFNLTHLKKLKDQLDVVLSSEEVRVAITAYNILAQEYKFLEIPGFNYIDPGFIETPIKATFLLLKGNIAYFYFSGFNLTPYLDETMGSQSFNMQNEATKAHVKEVQKVWSAWFYYIQQLHKAGTLGGVIIDVRGNGGGYLSDGQYVAGSLLPAGGFQYGYSRFKRGTGRYDYSPLMPAISPTMEGTHEIIDDKPVVLLTNSGSVSMSEMTTMVVKQMPNGTVIGKRTHGGLCALVGNESHSLNYAGHIGVNGQTPVYGYVPSLAMFTMDKQQLEGYGITPDIEVALDIDQFHTNGKDSQLDRALQFIRTGN